MGDDTREGGCAKGNSGFEQRWWDCAMRMNDGESEMAYLSSAFS